MAKDKNITVKISKSRKLQKKLNDLTVKYEETKSDLNNTNSCLSVYAKEKEELQNEIRQLEWENGEIRKDFDSCKSVLLANEMERQEMKKQISELESELRVKEDLFTIKGAISGGQPSVEWYEQRYQSDCITINQLHTTIDVLTDKLARLREVKGL